MEIVELKYEILKPIYDQWMSKNNKSVTRLTVFEIMRSYDRKNPI